MSDWQKHAALLDLQPSNRRLLQESRTPRTMRDAGLHGELVCKSYQFNRGPLFFMGGFALPFIVMEIWRALA